MTGGEDYELLFTARQGKRVRATCIGEITESQRVIVNASGKERPLSAGGYRHFQ
jgi:thiamine monophosphate kinase